MSEPNSGGSGTLVRETALPVVAEPAVLDDDEARLGEEIGDRISILEEPGYTDASLQPLNASDWTWIALLCGVAPVVLLIWGAFQM
jgi:hypothetical protein